MPDAQSADPIADTAPAVKPIDPAVLAKVEADVGAPIQKTLQGKLRILGVHAAISDEGMYSLAFAHQKYFSDGASMLQIENDTATIADADLTKEVKDAIDTIQAFALTIQ